MSEIEEILAFQLQAEGIPFEREYKAIPGRKFRWDFRNGNVLIEVQGGTWGRKRSGHSTGAGIWRDCEKNNLAVLHGFRPLLFTSDMVTSGQALELIIKLLDQDMESAKK